MDVLQGGTRVAMTGEKPDAAIARTAPSRRMMRLKPRRVNPAIVECTLTL